jgi:ubiquinone/menaquinone biosynthesis C-methylase UbiE
MAMALYQDWVVPVLIDLSMRNKRLRPYRERVAGAAEGRVLDVGIGSGLNLPFFGQRAREVFGLDPSSRLLARARDQKQHTQVHVHLLEGSAECIPLGDRSMDSVVMTWSGCSIPDVRAALREMRRVLRPGGRLLFVEHGRAPEPRVARWQERLDPLWLRLSGGCHLSRKIDDLLSDAGFRIEGLKTGYIPGPRIMTFLYEGTARPR